MPLKITHHVTKEPTSVLAILKKSFRLTRKEADTLFRLGAIYFQEERVFEDRELPAKAHLKIYLTPHRYPVNGIKWRELLLNDDKDYIAIHKPPEIPTHATVDNWYENALFQMRSLLNAPLFVTSRLDTPVSGILLFARTSAFQAKFNGWLKTGEVKKYYTAHTETPVPLGLHTHYMEPSQRVPKRLSSIPQKGWDLCQLKILSSGAETKIELLTGRTHQIRAQLSTLGHPILGDRLYGSKTPWPSPGIALLSTQIKFKGVSLPFS